MKPISIKKQLVVEAPRERAFAVYTAHMTRWWPKSHHIGKSALAEVIVEPRVGGRWFEICEDGSQCDWGKVLAWEPPTRLVLAWQLDRTYAFDPALVTEVEVVFTALAPARTRVDFEHRGLEKIGAEVGGERGMDTGWAHILDAFATVAAG